MEVLGTKLITSIAVMAREREIERVGGGELRCDERIWYEGACCGEKKHRTKGKRNKWKGHDGTRISGERDEEMRR